MPRITDVYHYNSRELPRDRPEDCEEVDQPMILNSLWMSIKVANSETDDRRKYPPWDSRGEMCGSGRSVMEDVA
jgi:hypothetical protein